VFIFPLVFVMVLVATMGNPVSAWTSPVIRNAWLTVHIVLVLLVMRRCCSPRWPPCSIYFRNAN